MEVVQSSTAHGLGREKQKRGAWERVEDVWPGFLRFHLPSPATTLSGSHPRRKCGILDSRNMNVTVCHAVAMPQGPRASPGKPQEWKQDMRP